MSDAIPQYCPTCVSRNISERLGEKAQTYRFYCNACGTIFNDDEDYSPTDDGKPDNYRLLNVKQLTALKALSDAFGQLSDVWSDRLGGWLDEERLLPGRDLSEASGELENEYQNGMLLLTALDVIRDNYKGSTEYIMTDGAYHFYETTHEGTGSYRHRVNLVSAIYESQYVTEPDLEQWEVDTVLTVVIQKEHLKLFPNPDVAV